MSTSTLKAWTRDEIARDPKHEACARKYEQGKLLLGLGDQVRLKRYMHLSRVYMPKGTEPKSESVSYQVTNPNGASPVRVKTCS